MSRRVLSLLACSLLPLNAAAQAPEASDLYASKTWQGAVSRRLTTFGARPVKAYVQRPAFELYDLTRDPLESTNLAGDPHYATVLAALKAKIKAFQSRTGDPWILKWDYE
jgi:N-sulfoglucosamine sulfohydrolase